jgi:hypothetical protein
MPTMLHGLFCAKIADFLPACRFVAGLKYMTRRAE